MTEAEFVELCDRLPILKRAIDDRMAVSFVEALIEMNGSPEFFKSGIVSYFTDILPKLRQSE